MSEVETKYEKEVQPEPTSYPCDTQQQADLHNRFTYHAPREDQPKRYVMLRESAKILAEMIVKLTPKSREQSLALTHLEETIFWANAAIARNEPVKIFAGAAL